MSVQVSLQPATLASTESLKGTSLVIAGTSFSQAFLSARDALTATGTPRTPDTGVDQKQKKADHAKEEGGFAPVVAVAVTPPAITLPPQAVPPSLPVQNNGQDESSPVATHRPEDTIAPHSLQADAETVGVTPAISPDGGQPKGVFAAQPPITEDGGSPVTSTKGPASEDVTAKDDAGSSSTGLAQPDPVPVAVATIDPSSLVAGSPAVDSAKKEALANPGADTSLQSAVVATSDPAQASTPIALTVDASVVAAQIVPDVPVVMDINMAASGGKALEASIDEQVSPPRSMRTGSSERTVTEIRAQKKTVGLDGPPSETPVSSVTAQISDTSGSSSHQGDTGQGLALEGMSTQASQPAVLPPSVQVHDAHTPALPATDGMARVPSANPSGVDAPPSTGISGARLIQSIRQSEMKVGMNSAEFGNISISTSVTHQVLSAQISLDHAELGHALMAHMPAMEQKLGDAYGLQTRVEIRGGGTSSSSDFAQHSGGSGRDRQDGSGKSTSHITGMQSSFTRTNSSPVAESSRLDIRI